MMPRWSTYSSLILGLGLACVAMSTPSAADTITLNGVAYRDVLIYESSSMYYIKVPHEGRVFNVPIDTVDRSKISILKDPYERDVLKRRFERAAKGQSVRRPDRSITGGGGALSILEPNPDSAVDNSAFLSAGGGPGLGIPRITIQNMMSGMGFSFTGDAQSATATSPDGSVTFRLFGPENELRGMSVSATVPVGQAPMIEASIKSSIPMIQAQAPWVAEWLSANMSVFKRGGAVEKTQDGVKISIKVSKSGGSVSIECQIFAV